MPVRVDASGQFLTHQLHSKHNVVKRSIPENIPQNGGRVSDSKTTNSDVDDSTLHYRIPLHAGKEVVVMVRENRNLLAPGAILETKVSRYGNVSDSEFKHLEHHRGCHFTGSVVGDPSSSVALAACNGLVSTTCIYS